MSKKVAFNRQSEAILIVRSSLLPNHVMKYKQYTCTFSFMFLSERLYFATPLYTWIKQ